MTALAFDPGGVFLASGDVDGNTHLWDGGTGSEFARIDHTSTVLALATGERGHTIASVHASGQVRIWEPFQAQMRSVEHPGGRLVCLSPCGDLVATGGIDGTVKVFDRSGSERASLAHQGPIVDLAFSPTGTLLATASTDGTARLWSAATGREELRQAHPTPARALAFLESGDGLVTAWADGNLRFGESRSVSHPALQAPYWLVRLGPCGESLAVSGPGGSVIVWSAWRAVEEARLDHSSPVRAMAWSRTGLLGTGTVGGEAHVWMPPGEHRQPAEASIDLRLAPPRAA